jgi:CheY-like chemotaxis protein
MGKNTNSIVILLAEDDDDDYLLTLDALREALITNEVYRVRNGEELIDYLLHQGSFQDPQTSPRPGLILLDLNMPRKDGREALHEIKLNPELKKIPVVVLTTSKADEDIIRSYHFGVNSFIKKPVSFDQLVDAMKLLGKYWLEIVELPG